jgi:DNA/RNA endonuclease G (NUC1)
MQEIGNHWKLLTREIAVKEDSVHIWAGNVGEIKRIGKVAVPKQCWKVVYSKKSNEWMAFIFENDQSNPDGINNNRVDLRRYRKINRIKI